MDRPLISIIIPTFGRPSLLPRAIKSALTGMGDNAEIIVVPNGPDTSWESVATSYKDDKRVHIAPVQIGHANVARNHGLSLARGEYVRFLDDDDYLLPEQANRQLADAQQHNADICSGNGISVDELGKTLRTWKQAHHEDLVVASLSPERSTLVFCHLFKRSAIHGHQWDERLDIRQDIDWILRLCTMKKFKWLQVDYPIGAWVQHGNARVSRGNDPGSKSLKHTADLIMAIVKTLDARQELTPERKKAAANGLWSALQKGVLYELGYWFKVHKLARQLSPDSRPPSRIYSLPLLKNIDPMFIAISLIPARWVLLKYRNIASKKRRASNP